VEPGRAVRSGCRVAGDLAPDDRPEPDRRPSLVALGGPGDADDAGSGFDRLPPGAAVVGGAAPDPGPEAAAEASDLRATIGTALAGMPDAERTVILLAYREGLTQSEIAERLEWPLGTVKTRTRRALARLRVVLETGDAGVGAGLPGRMMDDDGTR
jgi:RNA polymerase sigma factor (sigma-70 family)